jgi:hypothetical protein
VVHIAVLTGLLIGEILALRWKRIDLLLLRKTLEVVETSFEEEFGSPKTSVLHFGNCWNTIDPGTQTASQRTWS